MSKRRSNLEASEKLSQLNQRIVRQPKKEVKDSDIERGLYVLFAKDSMLEKGKPPFVRFSEMKKMKFKGDKAHGFLDKELTQPLRRKDCYVGREVYVSIEKMKTYFNSNFSIGSGIQKHHTMTFQKKRSK